jgi:hypothetical protein
MTISSGWIGRLRDVKKFLHSENADIDKDDSFILSEPGVIMFLGIVHDDNEAIISEETMYYVGGEPKPLAEGLNKAAPGISITVIHE